MEKPTFGILIRDRFGAEVFGTNTFHDAEAPAEHHSAEASTVEAELELNLGAGSYSITVALHSGSTHTVDNYDWIDHAIVFEIVPRPGDRFIGPAPIPCKLRWA